MRHKFIPFALLFLICGAAAQDRPPAPELRLSGGVGQWWLDTSFPDSWNVSAASRFYVSHRFAIEPEYSYSHSRGDTSYYNEERHSFVANAVLPFGHGERTRWYFFGGGGAAHWSSPRAVGSYWQTDFIAHVGVGADVDIGRRVFLSPQVRIGRGPMVGFGLGIGFKLR